MPLTVVTRQEHANKRWSRRTSFTFAANDAVTLLMASEVASAVHSLPIAFIKQGEEYKLVLVMGLEPGQNLLVSSTGKWASDYIPLSYKTGPFRMGSDENGNSLLCVDEATGLVSDGNDGERFFEDDGEPSESVNAVLALLAQIDSSRKVTDNICAIFAKHGLIEPWVITLDNDEQDQTVQGLYRVNEAALNALSNEDFLEVRRSGALSLVYCQLISMQNLKKLAPLLAQRQAVQKQTSMSDTFNFSNL
jgi:hypothetical protein